jgi:hypothetical protein
LPKNATYKYLGVPLTTKCNFKVARLKLDTRVRSIVAAVRSSRLSAREEICVFSGMHGRRVFEIFPQGGHCTCVTVKRMDRLHMCSDKEMSWNATLLTFT